MELPGVTDPSRPDYPESVCPDRAQQEARMELAQARKARIVPRTGGRALADSLVAQGIDHVFAVPGESYLDVLDGLYGVRQKLKLVTCRFEAGAVHMAEAFGKLKGRPAAARGGNGDAGAGRLPRG